MRQLLVVLCVGLVLTQTPRLAWKRLPGDGALAAMLAVPSASHANRFVPVVRFCTIRY